jgi:hypothetical protein
MHVGEKPYVVTTSVSLDAFRGPLAWGQVELATKRLTVEAVSGMLQQLLPPSERQELKEFGAIEYEMPPSAAAPGRFTVIAARGGDDIWLEVAFTGSGARSLFERPRPASSRPAADAVAAEQPPFRSRRPPRPLVELLPASGAAPQPIAEVEPSPSPRGEVAALRRP